MRLLITEDSRTPTDSLRPLLEKQGYAVDAVHDGENGLDYGVSNNYDLIIMDTVLPVRDGLSVLRSLRSEDIETPVLLLSDGPETRDCVAGLDCGADDYLTRPFDPQVLLARIRALTRRGQLPLQSVEPTIGDLTLDRCRMELCCGGKRVRLKAKEFQIMEYLIAVKPWVVPRQFLCERVWGMLSEAEYNNVEVYMTFLRRRLREVGSRVQIRFLRGAGYYLDAEE